MSLAAGMDTDVELWVDPELIGMSTSCSLKEILGTRYIRVTNVPARTIPATSYLAALSILWLLDDLCRPIAVGT